jgi:hypothetical protein
METSSQFVSNAFRLIEEAARILIADRTGKRILVGIVKTFRYRSLLQQFYQNEDGVVTFDGHNLRFKSTFRYIYPEDTDFCLFPASLKEILGLKDHPELIKGDSVTLFAFTNGSQPVTRAEYIANARQSLMLMRENPPNPQNRRSPLMVQVMADEDFEAVTTAAWRGLHIERGNFDFVYSGESGLTWLPSVPLYLAPISIFMEPGYQMPADGSAVYIRLAKDVEDMLYLMVRFERVCSEKHVCRQCGVKCRSKCSSCLTSYYCSPKCQTANWSDHKKICSRLK